MLGDARCGIDLRDAAYRATVIVADVDAQGRLRIDGATGFADRWFERGQIEVLSGTAAGVRVMVKADRLTGSGRLVELWHSAGLAAGDSLILQAGCDRRAETCQKKFSNFINFRGFPHIPGEDWLASYPVSSLVNDGGSLKG